MKYFCNNITNGAKVRDYNNISVSDSVADISYHLFITYKIQKSFNFTSRLAFVK